MIDLLLYGLLVFVLAYAVMFAGYWIVNQRIYMSAIRHREWWRNRPTWRDPKRWERYVQAMEDRR